MLLTNDVSAATAATPASTEKKRMLYDELPAASCQ
jgi:hypothetical protein